MSSRNWMSVAWPAFLAACAMEFLVFGLFDPHDLHWLGQQIELSRKGIYTIGFFSFWAVSIGAGSMTVLLMREPSSDIPPD